MYRRKAEMTSRLNPINRMLSMIAVIACTTVNNLLFPGLLSSVYPITQAQPAAAAANVHRPPISWANKHERLNMLATLQRAQCPVSARKTRKARRRRAQSYRQRYIIANNRAKHELS